MANLTFDSAKKEKILNIWAELLSMMRSFNVDFEAEILKRKRKYEKERSSLALEVIKKYPLTSKQGLSLMSLAECLPRIENKVLKKKLVSQALANFNNLGALADKALTLESAQNLFFEKTIKSVSDSFVWSTSLSNMNIQEGSFISIDCLGEAAQTKEECDGYLEKYKNALRFCLNQSFKGNAEKAPATMSVKTSAITTEFDCFNSIEPALAAYKDLFKEIENKSSYISITLDAEEAHRSSLQRELFTLLNNDSCYKTLFLSIAQQAYLADGLDGLIDLYQKNQNSRRFGVRIVKGAYYDYEVREAQKLRYTCPVFEEKYLTDISWSLMALVAGYSENFSHFATHNPQSLAFVELIADLDDKYENFGEKIRAVFGKFYKNLPESLFDGQFLSGGAEFQYLHGMGGLRQKTAASELSAITEEEVGFRAYAPIGGQKELLPYLVRRLLENGVNNGVWQSPDAFIYGKPPTNREVSFKQKALTFVKNLWPKQELPQGSSPQSDFKRVPGLPWWSKEFLGIFKNKASYKGGLEGISVAKAEQTIQDSPLFVPLEQRVGALDRLAKALEANQIELMQILNFEVKKHPIDAMAEWQEACDFIGFYSHSLKTEQFKLHQKLPLVHAEENTAFKVGMKNVLCISPWNFPLAITLGQVAAAIAAGVRKIYLKPSPKLSLIYSKLQEVLKQAKIDVVFVVDEIAAFEPFMQKMDCVLFTGSNQAFNKIKEICSQYPVKLIGETAGVNSLIADASAEPGFVADTLIKSSFNFSGQRCSCVRVAFIDESIYKEVVKKLKTFDIKWGLELNSTGRSLIDDIAENGLKDYVSKAKDVTQNGQGFIVEANEFEDINWTECFGPVLQVHSYNMESGFESLVSKIRAKNYGLTFTLLSKDKEKMKKIAHCPLAGNQYINRVSTGAVVNAQPFGGFGLSGTGPKIGSLELIEALSLDCVISFDTVSIGGTSGIFENKKVPKLIEISDFLK